MRSRTYMARSLISSRTDPAAPPRTAMRARNSNVVSALTFLAPTSPCLLASSLTRAPNTIGTTASEIRKPRSAAMRAVYLRHRMAS